MTEPLSDLRERVADAIHRADGDRRAEAALTTVVQALDERRQSLPAGHPARFGYAAALGFLRRAGHVD